MGTRAIIEKGNKFYATHWDGYPDDLGQHLLDGWSMKDITNTHTLDSTNKKTYNDWAEFQYIIKGNKVYCRALGGAYPKSIENADKLKLLGTIGKRKIIKWKQTKGVY